MVYEYGISLMHKIGGHSILQMHLLVNVFFPFFCICLIRPCWHGDIISVIELCNEYTQRLPRDNRRDREQQTLLKSISSHKE